MKNQDNPWCSKQITTQCFHLKALKSMKWAHLLQINHALLAVEIRIKLFRVLLDQGNYHRKVQINIIKVNKFQTLKIENIWKIISMNPQTMKLPMLAQEPKSYNWWSKETKCKNKYKKCWDRSSNNKMMSMVRSLIMTRKKMSRLKILKLKYRFQNKGNENIVQKIYWYLIIIIIFMKKLIMKI